MYKNAQNYWLTLCCIHLNISDLATKQISNYKMYYFYDVKRARVGDVRREQERQRERTTDHARERKANEE